MTAWMHVKVGREGGREGGRVGGRAGGVVDDEAQQMLAQLIKWCKAHHGEAMTAWMHVKVDREGGREGGRGGKESERGVSCSYQFSYYLPSLLFLAQQQ